MPSIPENLERWEHHPWTKGGDEWSPGASAAGTDVLWRRTLLPRIHEFVPTGTVVEIGPGFGRWTQYLHRLCSRLVLVDVTPRCLESCRERFSAERHLEYVLNDGASLAAIDSGSVDFVFSFDSLVHAEADAVDGYLREFARILKPGGSAFIHHSNLGAFVSRRTGRIHRCVTATNWRAPSVSAEVVRSLSRAAGLHCESQEIINWIGRRHHADRHRLRGERMPLTDCLSVFRTDRPADAATRIAINTAFVDEWRQAAWMARLYPAGLSAPETSRPPASAARKTRTALRILTREGVGTFGATVVAKLSAAVAASVSRAAAAAHGELARAELRRLRRGARRDGLLVS